VRLRQTIAIRSLRNNPCRFSCDPKIVLEVGAVNLFHLRSRWPSEIERRRAITESICQGMAVNGKLLSSAFDGYALPAPYTTLRLDQPIGEVNLPALVSSSGQCGCRNGRGWDILAVEIGREQ
jgi:hypothetical protein